MLEKIEEYLNTIDFKTLSMMDLKLYTEIAISIEHYKDSKDMMKNLSNAPETLVLN
ncbi:MAG: hypothetical protein NC087_01990 [Anaeroplasma bactoclasticum]|nr:hypothetical protein [Anaeroplasma bactoclasticum]